MKVSPSAMSLSLIPYLTSLAVFAFGFELSASHGLTPYLEQRSPAMGGIA